MAKLLKGGVVLLHGDNDKITPAKTDILVQNNRIVRIEKDILPSEGYDVLDCTDKIISPGFVDTHHHLWQSMLKGCFGDAQFLPYLATITALGLKITPEELFWGNLAGSMEAIDAGTTTVLDHAHLNWSSKHSKPALAGTISSGIRSIFAYTPSMVLDSTTPTLTYAQEPFPSWIMDTLASLSKTSPLTNLDFRVKLGLGFDLYFMGRKATQVIIAQARALGVDLITSHAVKFNGERSTSHVKTAHDYGVLDGNIVFSHLGGATVEDVKLLTEANAFVSVTPSTEQAMTVGPSVCFRNDLPGMDSLCSLGIDCHCATSSSMVNEMRMGLQSARGLDSIEHRKNGVVPEKVHHTTGEVFNMGTIQGARALNMQKDIGSIAVGKMADLVVFDTLSPAMFGVAQVDPVMAIVLHSSIGDVEAVMVDGEYRKRGGRLLAVNLMGWEEEGKLKETTTKVGWRDVGGKILQSQRRLLPMLPELGLEELEKTLRANFAHY